ncbi:MAG: DUF3348 domain-containing protein [Rhodoferax sp.]|nr:DUF3348 domain-containing protein [Rhodoferax sp.]
MTRALTRTNFHSSRLIRVLADLAVVDAVEPGTAFAEKLGLWLNLHDAITLCAALNESTASQPPAQIGVKSVTSVAIGDEFAQVRTTLVNSITKSCPPNLGADYEPYRRYYSAHQRDMDSSVRPLRSKVREVLARASPALRQLAALDATLDAILCERESKLLSTVPLLLKRRFEQLRQAHRQMLVDTQQADDPALWMKSGAWLARFCNELQTALLAELDLRLQPTVGLIEAINNEMTKHK